MFIKRTNRKWYIALNVKRRHQGLGKTQLIERRDTQSNIGYYLYELSTKSKLNEKTGEWKHQLASIRHISRVTGYHRNTVRKALEREKQAMQVLEVHGTNNSRLFALTGSDFEDEIMKKCKNNKKYFNWLLKINPHLKKIYYNWLQVRKKGGRAIERWPKHNPIERKINKKYPNNDYFQERERISKKRSLMHVRNKLAWRKKRNYHY